MRRVGAPEVRRSASGALARPEPEAVPVLRSLVRAVLVVVPMRERREAVAMKR